MGTCGLLCIAGPSCNDRTSDAGLLKQVLIGIGIAVAYGGICFAAAVSDEGAVSWEAAQPSNDLAKVIREYGDRITVVGGYDTQGLPGRPGVPDEEIEAEVHRMMDAYAPLGSFISMGFLLTNDPDPMAFVMSMMRIAKYIDELRYNYYK